MARYIDLDKVFPYGAFCVNSDNPGASLTELLNRIGYATVADVAEVVRCKDCKYKVLTEEGEYNSEDIVCSYHMSDGFTETDYCSHGVKGIYERSDDE